MFDIDRCLHFRAAALMAAALAALWLGCAAPNCTLTAYADRERPVTPAAAVYVQMPDDADHLTVDWYHRLRRLMTQRDFNLVSDPANAECLLHFEIDPVKPAGFPDSLASITIKVYDREEYTEGALLAKRLVEDSLAQRVPVIVRTRWSGALEFDASLLKMYADDLAARLLTRFGGSATEEFRLKRKDISTSRLPDRSSSATTKSE